ncbi:hypothetical protein ACQEWB_29175 [Streptomyces sp. CA-249302]|uniref:hypothetical protein n=1 Tax=Streptomyces sp. CA-249302 TaxID=3240058 RepID=UPI003D9071A1
MRERGERSVSAGGGIGTAITGDNNQVLLAPAVRSAYWEQVRRIAPAELLDREAELTDLADFCTTDSGPSYAWWRAGAWAGKTALLSWFALHPPAGVRVVPFFVTARLGAQNDVIAYVDVVLEQLAELTGEGIPAYLTPATREAHLLRLYGEAARACGERGERLVLLVDGLDEDRGVTTGPDAHSIASLLPGYPEHGMRVVIASRLNPPLPGDVAGDHPLWQPEVVRLLRRSPRAEVIRAEAERELKRLIEAGGLEHDLLALVTAAGGGLTAGDLATLTGKTSYRVQDILRTRAGRTFAVRASVYLLGHEELQSRAEEILGESELACHRAQLHAWADGWQEQGWPEATPEYLLRGYFPMLRATADLDRMTSNALDSTRHERMFEATGGDAAALDEIRAAQELMVERTEQGQEADLLGALRLAMHRDELAGRSARIPGAVAEAWAVLGQGSRAEALAYSQVEPESRARALIAVASRLAAGDRERALTLLTDAQACVGLVRRSDDRDRVTRQVCHALIELDECARAAELLGSLVPPLAQEVSVELVRKHLSEGRFESASEVADWTTGPRERALAVGALVAARLRGMDTGAAEADRLLDETVRGLESPWGVVEALVDAGEVDRAVALVTRLPKLSHRTAGVRGRDPACAELARAEASRGDFGRAEAWLTRIRDSELSDAVRADVAAELVRRGQLPRADRLAATVDGDRQKEWEWVRARVAGALAEAGDLEQAADRADDLVLEPARAHVMVALAEAGARLGEEETALALIREIADFPFTSDGMPAVALALATHGCVGEAEEILAELEAEARGAVLVPRDLFTLADALKALAEAGYPDEAVAVVTTEPPMLAHLEALVWPDDDYGLDLFLMAGCEVLASVGEFERLEAMLEDAPDHLGILFPLAEALAVAGQIERVRALLAGCRSESTSNEVLAAVARALVLEGQTERALESVRAMAGPEKVVATLARLARTAADLGSHGDAESLLGNAIQLADDILAPGRLAPQSDLVETLVALGHTDAARSRLITLLDHARHDLDVSELPAYARLLAFVGWHDKAEILANGIGDTETRASAQAEVAKVLAEAGEYERAERLARRITPQAGITGDVLAEIARHADEPSARRLVVAALTHVRWTEALPALLRLEPRAVPLVVEALSGPVRTNTPSGATWKHWLGVNRPTALRTSDRSST